MSALGRFMHDLGRGWRDAEIQQLRAENVALQIERDALVDIVAHLMSGEESTI